MRVPAQVDDELRAEIAVLQKSNAALKAENAALEQRIAALIDAT